MKHVIFDCDGTLVDTRSLPYKLFPGILELLEALKTDCHLYVWTARGRSSLVKVLENQGILGYFDALSTPDDHAPKPHIGGLKALVGTQPKTSICIIGDSPHDMEGAKAFGVLGIGAQWENVEKVGGTFLTKADFLVSHPMDCCRIVELNLKGERDV